MSYFQPEFSARSAAVKVRFGPGVRNEIAREIQDLGAKRALILSTPQQAETTRDFAQNIGELAAGIFSGAAMHTPVSVTDEAMARVVELDADCLVAIGGGSTTGLGKAIAYRRDLPQIVVPTTYAGSSAPILGQTDGNLKTTLSDPKVQPEVILYDADLVATLPIAVTVASAMNAIAHAAEALYARDRNPLSTALAIEGMRAFASALPQVIKNPVICTREARLSMEHGYAERYWVRWAWLFTINSVTPSAEPSNCRMLKHTRLSCLTQLHIIKRRRQISLLR